MSSTEPLAEVRDIRQLHAALRARAVQLQITRELIDEISGMTPGYAGKLLAPDPQKHLGLKSMAPLLGALALKLHVVHDEEAYARIKNRLEPADHKRARWNHQNCKRRKAIMKLLVRATEDFTNLGMGFYNKGQEFTLQGWPRIASGNIEGVTEEAKRFLRYWGSNRTEALFPDTPWLAEYGRIFLPHHLPRDHRNTRLPSLPREEIVGMPRYRAEWRGQYGSREVQIGEEVAYCGWPEHGLVPINDAAKAVADYYDKNKGNPKLMSAPWCDYAQALFLPELPAPKEPQYARNLQDNRDPWLDELNKRRIAQAVATLNKPAAKSRARGARRRVPA